MRNWFIAILVTLALCVQAMAEDTSIGVTPAEMKWKDNGDGSRTVILDGDPSGNGTYVLRIQAPPNHTTQPHTHPQAENITVISGWLGFGLGTVFDRSKGRVLPAGSFFHLPANTPHFGWTGPEGVVIQAHGNGPFP